MAFFDCTADLVGQLNGNGQKGMVQIDAPPVENFWLRHWPEMLENRLQCFRQAVPSWTLGSRERSAVDNAQTPRSAITSTYFVLIGYGHFIELSHVDLNTRRPNSSGIVHTEVRGV